MTDLGGIKPSDNRESLVDHSYTSVDECHFSLALCASGLCGHRANRK